MTDFTEINRLREAEEAAREMEREARYRQPDPKKLYAIPFPRKLNEKTRERGSAPEESDMQTLLVKPYPEQDGGMVGMLDPNTGKYVGACGIFYWNANAKLVTYYEFAPGDD